MKKIALFCAAAVAFSAFAEDVMFTFSSSGDTYRDGSPVAANEVYALVWSDGGAFNITSDGTVTGGEIVRTSFADPKASDAERGCFPTLFVMDSSELKATGSYQLYLLDTRVFAADGTAGAPSGLTGGKLTNVNGFASVTSAEFKPQDELAANDVKATEAGGSAMGFVGDTPNPNIKEITVKDGRVVITVSNVVPYVPYTISCGETPNALTRQDIATVLPISGGTTTITVADPGKNRFFKVISK